MEGRKLKQIKVHPKFNPQSFENDLALLKLISPVKYQANILPACVPQDDQHLEVAVSTNIQGVSISSANIALNVMLQLYQQIHIVVTVYYNIFLYSIL